MTDQFVGEIRMTGFNFAPSGWAMCNGQLLSISQNTALFSLLGTNYGGNGTSNFALPNLQGNVPMFFGQGPGLSSQVQGATGGSATVTLLTTQMPSHAHSVQPAWVGRGGTASAKPAAGGSVTAAQGGNLYAASTPGAAMDPSAVSAVGGSMPHNNLMPYLTLNFIIALSGIFPSRS